MARQRMKACLIIIIVEGLVGIKLWVVLVASLDLGVDQLLGSLFTFGLAREGLYLVASRCTYLPPISHQVCSQRLNSPEALCLMIRKTHYSQHTCVAIIG